MACLSACLGFMWLPISGTLEDILQRGAREAFTFAFNWIVKRVRGTDSRELLANFPHGVVGAEEPLSKTRRLLEDDGSKIIGIYGMGGIGKTTLLKTINDEYLKTRSELFDIVIFITVSKVFLVDSIQKRIGEKLEFEDNFGHDTADRSTKLFNELRKKKFLLLLDDLWEKLDLAVVGVPHADYSKKGSKVVFTTRSNKVCNAMGASLSKVKVSPLTTKNSWELFCKSLGKRDDQWTDSTRPLAEAVAKRCGGLPLALIVVGRAMADAAIAREWVDALRTMRGAAAEFEEIKEEVLPILKFSFDRLKNDEDKECLLYCCLFSDNYFIDTNKLIDYWIAEGLLGSVKCSLDTARKRGMAAINTLKSVCLLEGHWIEGLPCVRLHDMVREMALWITSGTCRAEKITFLANPGEKLKSGPISNRWADAMKISLMDNYIEELPEQPECHNLRILFLNYNEPLIRIPCGFFQSMPLLTVLDISSTRINLIPPGIGLLVHLRFLNLAYTHIESLPIEVGRLKKLAILNLQGTRYLARIPNKAISSLSSLRLLNSRYTHYEWRGGWSLDCGETGVCLRDLDSLKQLEELHLMIKIMNQEDWRGLSNSRILLSLVRDLELKRLSTSSINWSCNLKDPKELRTLFIEDCSELKQMIFPANKLRRLEELKLIRLPLETISLRIVKGYTCFENLEVLRIHQCMSLKEITWIRGLLCLETLVLEQCDDMVEIIRDEEADVNGVVNQRDSFFPKLAFLKLNEMLNLKTICRHALLFPCFKQAYVANCPKLNKLPFGFDSAKNVRVIVGEREWWHGLEWDDQNIRSKFAPYFSALK